MSYGEGKKNNGYARAARNVQASKTVWMAIAVSFAERLEPGLLAEESNALERFLIDE
jgi:hypothetical protein